MKQDSDHLGGQTFVTNSYPVFLYRSLQFCYWLPLLSE